jgi:hypothetical protein
MEADTSRVPFEPYREADILAPNRFAPSVNPHQVAARGFAQSFGLLPGVAFLTVGTDIMLHGAAVITAGLLIPFSILGGGMLGYITYKWQMKEYGDDAEAAKIKALIVAFLTAIPSPLPYMLFIPAGIVGLFRKR